MQRKPTANAVTPARRESPTPTGAAVREGTPPCADRRRRQGAERFRDRREGHRHAVATPIAVAAEEHAAAGDREGDGVGRRSPRPDVREDAGTSRRPRRRLSRTGRKAIAMKSRGDDGCDLSAEARSGATNQGDESRSARIPARATTKREGIRARARRSSKPIAEGAGAPAIRSAHQLAFRTPVGRSAHASRRIGVVGRSEVPRVEPARRTCADRSARRAGPSRTHGDADRRNRSCRRRKERPHPATPRPRRSRR
jgi:hypothetical protein